MSRNALLSLNTKIGICALSVAFGGMYIDKLITYLQISHHKLCLGFGAGVFGMNLSNVSTIQNLPNSFIWVTACLVITLIAIAYTFILYFTAIGILPKQFNGSI